MRLIGFDPGLRTTGWGVIEVSGSRLRHIANGLVTSDGEASTAIRLTQIYDGLAAIIAEHHPALAAVEETFVNTNATTTLKLGLARGAVLLAPARAGLDVAEYSANAVKKAVVGVGHADKTQVQMMVRRLLPGVVFAGPDAADALAVAICHAHHAQSRNAWANATVMAGGGEMIAKLTGIVDSVSRDHAIIDVNGVGYLVRCSARTLGALPKSGGPVSLAVETLVREDAIDLYGFSAGSERDWFRLLTTVQGVGAKVALSILSTLSADELSQAIMAQDKAMVSRADGVGPKLANRIVSELKDKVASGAFTPIAQVAAATGLPADAVADAISALVNLGYRRAEAMGAVDRAARKLGPSARIEALIPAGLKELGT